MPDIADAAENTIQLELNAQLSAIRSRTGPQLAPIGCCHNCEADVGPGQLFCEPIGSGMSECQQDYEKRVRRAA